MTEPPYCLLDDAGGCIDPRQCEHKPQPVSGEPHQHQWKREYAPGYRQASEANDWREECACGAFRSGTDDPLVSGEPSTEIHNLIPGTAIAECSDCPNWHPLAEARASASGITAPLDVDDLERQIRAWHDSSEPARSFAERISRASASGIAAPLDVGALRRAGWEPDFNVCASCHHHGSQHDLANKCLVCGDRFSGMSEDEKWAWGAAEYARLTTEGEKP